MQCTTHHLYFNCLQIFYFITKKQKRLHKQQEQPTTFKKFLCFVLIFLTVPKLLTSSHIDMIMSSKSSFCNNDVIYYVFNSLNK